MNSKMQLAEILSLKYLSGFCFTPDDKQLVFLWNDGGITNAYSVKSSGTSLPVKITNAESSVSGMVWSSLGYLGLNIDGNIYIYNSQLNLHKQVTTEGGYRSKISWNNEGNILTYTNGDFLCLYNIENNQSKILKPLGEVFGGKFSQTIGSDSFSWSPDDNLFMYTYTKNKRPFLALINRNGEHVYTSVENLKTISEGKWLSNNTFVYCLYGRFSSEKEYYLANIPQISEWNNYNHINAVCKFIPTTSKLFEFKLDSCSILSSIYPLDEKNILVGSEISGYYHYYMFNLDTKELSQLTYGECEDFGQMGDMPCILPDKSGFIFASNKAHRIERQLYKYSFCSKSLTQLTSMPVTNTSPICSNDGTHIAYFHADCKRNGDLWILDIDTYDEIQLTNSMPHGLSDKLVNPELISYKGAENWDIDAFIYKPHNFDESKEYPAIVWVHGGPIRQMRGSFHPSATYSHYYAFNQFLANQGFIIISPNFRGGIGYGRMFRHGLYLKKGINDTIDVTRAADYLKSKRYIKKDKIAVYGLSYGGYMTLHSLTQYPEVFAAGINLAGLWDIAQWARWIKDSYGNYTGDAYFGGEIEERPDLWSLGSPVTYKHNLCKPLMSFQGTGDLNVDFNQLNTLIKDLNKMGADHDFYYYPDETHSFRWRHTWCDVLPRIVAFFNIHLTK